MKLYLASYAKDTIAKIFNHANFKPKNKTAVFIPTAGDPYENKDFVEADRKALEKYGMKIDDLDLRSMGPSEIRTKIANTDLILVAGGDTFYLMSWLIKSGANLAIKDFVEKGGIYIGSSAGSIVCCRTIAGAETFDNPALGFNLKNYDGLGLFPNVIIPHTQKEKYYERVVRATRKLAEQNLVVFPITDDDVVFYDGNQTIVL